jgi:hypothetical protein
LLSSSELARSGTALLYHGSIWIHHTMSLWMLAKRFTVNVTDGRHWSTTYFGRCIFGAKEHAMHVSSRMREQEQAEVGRLKDEQMVEMAKKIEELKDKLKDYEEANAAQV